MKSQINKKFYFLLVFLIAVNFFVYNHAYADGSCSNDGSYTDCSYEAYYATGNSYFSSGTLTYDITSEGGGSSTGTIIFCIIAKDWTGGSCQGSDWNYPDKFNEPITLSGNGTDPDRMAVTWAVLDEGAPQSVSWTMDVTQSCPVGVDESTCTPPPQCGLSPQNGRIIVDFGSKHIHDGADQASATSGPFPFSIPAGNYDVTAYGYDAGHTPGVPNPDDGQPYENYITQLFDSDGNLITWTTPGPDVSDDELTSTGVTDTNMNIPTDVAFVSAYMPSWFQGYGSGVGNSVNTGCVAFDPVVEDTSEPATVIVSAVTCNAETDLPNWSLSSNNIVSDTATNYVASHPSCHLESGWSFQSSLMTESGGCTGYGTNDLPNGDTIGLATASGGHCPWVTFGPTNSSGIASFDITSPLDGPNDKIWIREALKSNYVVFSLPPGPESDVSAEMWCDDDVAAYDDGDAIHLISPGGTTYYCVAFNAHDPAIVATGHLTATPNPCTVTTGNTSCTSNVAVYTSNVGSAAVVAISNGDPSTEEYLLGPGNIGGTNRDAYVGLPPNYYDFYLYDYSSGARGALLDSVHITTIADIVIPPTQYSVTVIKTAGGSIRSNDNNIVCGTTCTANYDEGSSVTLTATPSSSYWRFVGWSGDCTGTSACHLTVDGTKTVTAIFSLRQFNYIEI